MSALFRQNKSWMEYAHVRRVGVLRPPHGLAPWVNKIE